MYIPAVVSISRAKARSAATEMETPEGPCSPQVLRAISTSRSPVRLPQEQVRETALGELHALLRDQVPLSVWISRLMMSLAALLHRCFVSFYFCSYRVVKSLLAPHLTLLVSGRCFTDSRAKLVIWRSGHSHCGLRGASVRCTLAPDFNLNPSEATLRTANDGGHQ